MTGAMAVCSIAAEMVPAGVIIASTGVLTVAAGVVGCVPAGGARRLIPGQAMLADR